MNQRTSKARAAYYAGLAELYVPERRFLETLVSPSDSFLDIGVGADRTTLHVEPRVARYVGVDYSPEMIAALRRRFPALPAERFALADARDLPFEDASFDRTMFSFNGLDYVPRADRGRVLSEVRRVTKDDGYFLFSTHNIDWEGLDDSLCLKREDWIRPRSIARHVRMCVRNRTLSVRAKMEAARRQGYGVVAGSAVRSCYTSYGRQIAELGACGFAAITAFALDGAESDDPTVLAKSPFIHFLTRIEKNQAR